MDNRNFSYIFHGETGTEWTVIMSNDRLEINGVNYERNEDDPTYDFAIAMHKVLNEKS